MVMFNQDYPWYLQNSTRFTALYNGMYEVATHATCLPVWKIFYPERISLYISGEEDMPASGLKTFAGTWMLGTEWTSTVNALIYDEGEWSGRSVTSQNKLWSGERGDIPDEWFRRYILMKCYLKNKLFNYETISEAFLILLGSNSYSISVTEGTMECTITITTSSDVVLVLNSISTFDHDLFGHPTGIKINYSFVTQ